MKLEFIVLVLIVTASCGDPAQTGLALSWTDNASDEDGFTIERKLGANGAFAEIASVGADVTSYADKDVMPEGEYCYRIRAFNTAGNSDYSNESCGVAVAARVIPVQMTETTRGARRE